MKNAIVKFSLTALAAFTLAACGSSGGVAVIIPLHQAMNKKHR